MAPVDKDPFRTSALAQAGHDYTVAELKMAAARHARDKAIVDSSLRGLTRRQVAELAGVTVGRVQQILDNHVQPSQFHPDTLKVLRERHTNLSEVPDDVVAAMPVAQQIHRELSSRP